MSKHDDGGAIHPILTARTQMREAPDYEIEPTGGLTKREWYAGLAMQDMAWINVKTDGSGLVEPEKIAKCAFELADAMIAEGKKE